MRRLLPLALLPVALAALAADGLPPGVKDTQKPGDVPPPPQRAADLFHPLPGFSVTLFAGEPHVSQPIALDLDRRGRLWVAECFSYPEWKDAGIDRVLIFDDKDGDGSFDARTLIAAIEIVPRFTGICVNVPPTSVASVGRRSSVTYLRSWLIVGRTSRTTPSWKTSTIGSATSAIARHVPADESSKSAM